MIFFRFLLSFLEGMLRPFRAWARVGCLPRAPLVPRCTLGWHISGLRPSRRLQMIFAVYSNPVRTFGSPGRLHMIFAVSCD
jgi:hypothetical protein